ncbi:hypothetical protein J5N97_022797 [Dioscorea zingiberensis]|uniref:GDSL esterase/lipase EXL3 n=1 Tax=Dioscorea zingiberensis TaxID=325984 RepID=A0A9D5CBV7_9LILI|nr:hypothetical protein J5N97_022797 [Dioscorea zingiberensis]
MQGQFPTHCGSGMMDCKCLMKPTCTLFYLFLISLELFKVQSLAPNKTASNVPAVIVFGDSIVDPGNNNEIETLIKCNFPPYGKDFTKRIATGRFCNGKIPSDFIASQLGIKELVPAYLGTKLTAQDLLTGVSFASGGAGYDPLTARLVSVLTMNDQLDLFKEYKEKLRKVAGEGKANTTISKSLYVVVTGTDDLANTYFGTPFRRAEFNLPSYINFTVDCASSFYKELYHLGARKIAVVGVPPVGCVPSQRTIEGGLERHCVPLYNQAAVMFNSKLSTELDRLNKTLPGAQIVYIDIYTPLLDLIKRPFAYGFEESTKGCCGTGYFEVTLACNSLTTSTCEDASKFVFWDSYHPTERAYNILIRGVFQRYGSLLN